MDRRRNSPRYHSGRVTALMLTLWVTLFASLLYFTNAPECRQLGDDIPPHCAE